MTDQLYRIRIKAPGKLLSIALDSEISEAQLQAIFTVLKIHDHSDEAPCYCVWQFPDNCNLTMLWADAQRRANALEFDAEGTEIPRRIYPGSVEWIRRQPGYLPRILTSDSPEVVEAKLRSDPDFRKPGERVNGIYTVVPAGEALRREQAERAVRPDTDQDHEMMIGNDTAD